MAEGQVSIDGELLKLEDLFFVIATQNPIESRGTYPLPEAQMDRFSMQLSLGYIPVEQEVAVLTEQRQEHPINQLSPCVSVGEILRLKKMIADVFISEELKKYIVDIVDATRSEPGVVLGASPRASISLMKIASSLALFDDLDFVSPDHIQEIAVPVIAHRLVMDPQARFAGKTARFVVEDILKNIPVPV